MSKWNCIRMDVNTAKAKMCDAGLTIRSEVKLRNGYGTQVRTAEGPMLIVYKSGKCVPGGREQYLLEPILEGFSDPAVQVAKCDRDRLRELERENRRLKQLLAERDLVIEAMKQDSTGRF